MLTLFLLSYTLGAVVTYGAHYAFFERKYPAAENIWFALFGGATWPVANMVTLLVYGKRAFQYGLKFY